MAGLSLGSYQIGKILPTELQEHRRKHLTSGCTLFSLKNKIYFKFMCGLKLT